MTIPPLELPDDRTDVPDELGVFARIREEHALLLISVGERTREQRDRPSSIGRELDRVFEALRRRAARLESNP